MRRLVALLCLFTLSVTSCTNMPVPPYEYGDMDTWQSVRFGGVIKQKLDFSCGLTSLATVFKYHYGEDTITEEALLDKFIQMLPDEELAQVYSEGASIAQLAKLAETYNYATRLSKPSFSELKTLSSMLPVIVFLETAEFKHFAVLRGISEQQVLLADSSRGNIRLSIKQFKDEWKRHGALIIAKSIVNLKDRLLHLPNPIDRQAGAELARSVILR